LSFAAFSPRNCVQKTMDTTRFKAPLSANVRTPARTSLIQRQLARYCARLQPRVRALASRDTRLADLAVSYPALLFALAVPRRGIDPAPIIAGVINGEPLTMLSAAAGLPVWLRRLPPEAFVRAIAPLPDGDAVRRHIPNHIPKSAKELPEWLDAVAEAYSVGDERIALWIAGEKRRDPKAIKPRLLRRTCLWAWISYHASNDPQTLIVKQWQPSMSFTKANQTARTWLSSINIKAHTREQYLKELWIEPATINGFDLVPLQTAHDFAEEAEAMNNCLADYAHNIEAYGGKVWSVRKNDVRMATLEIRRDACRQIYVFQLVGNSNNDPAAAEMAAVVRWVQTCARVSPIAPPVPDQSNDPIEEPRKRAIWIGVWRTYWRAKRRVPMWLPIGYSCEALNELRFPR
jgi:hypothetical protein